MYVFRTAYLMYVKRMQHYTRTLENGICRHRLRRRFSNRISKYGRSRSRETMASYKHFFASWQLHRISVATIEADILHMVAHFDQPFLCD